MRQWWVTQAGQAPIGPVTEETLVRGIQAGRVPDDALICEVGGRRWRGLAEVQQFAKALASATGRARQEPDCQGPIEPATILESQPFFWDEPEARTDRHPAAVPDASHTDVTTDPSMNPPTDPSDEAQQEERTLVELVHKPARK